MEKKKMRIAILIHPTLNPLKRGLSASKHVDSPCKTESFVFSTLKKMGHEAEFLELDSNLDPLVEKVNASKIDVIFNLLEELSGEAKFDFHAVSYLESKGIHFTGNGPRSLMVTRDKNLSKLMLEKEGVTAPRGRLIRTEKDLKRINFSYPIFLKFNSEDASYGITQSNRASTSKQLKALFKRLRSISDRPILAEEFVPGDDISVGVLGNKKLKILPARGLKMPNKNWVAGENIKFESRVRRKDGIISQRYRWKNEAEKKTFEFQAKLIYRSLGMRGYGRLDFRRSQDGRFYFLEANANPDLAKDEDFAVSAQSGGISYPQLLASILKLGKELKR